MRIALYKDSQASFLRALDAAAISYEEIRPMPGQVVASGTVVVVAQTAAIAGSIATVLVAWIKARASRKIILTLQGNRVVQLEGYTVEQVQELLSSVEHMTAIDTLAAHQSDNVIKS